jgi:hypothetical protein
MWPATAAVVAVLALSACSPIITLQGQPTPVAHTATTPPVTTTPSATPIPTPPPIPVIDFAPAIDRAVTDMHGGEISLLVYDRYQESVVASYKPDQAYHTESVVKLLIGLNSLDHGGSTSRVAEMLARSDDATATNLWDVGGGPAVVTRMAAKIGLKHTTPPTSRPGEWGDTRTTASDLLLIYEYILGEAPASERDVVLNALHNAPRIAWDGTDQYFGIPDAVGHSQPWAVKQGWACCEPGWVLNTTGLIGENERYIVIALTSHDNGGGSAVRAEDSTELTHAISALLPDLKP